MERTQRSKPALYAAIKDGTFPRPVKIGVRAVAWVDDDVNHWVEQRIAAAKAGAA